jgi:putative endonuclease
MKKKTDVYYVYMVICSDETFYTGYTNNLGGRVEKHNSGKGAKYTRGRGPVKLVYTEKYCSKSKAMKREYQIKQLTHMEKFLLAAEK